MRSTSDQAITFYDQVLAEARIVGEGGSTKGAALKYSAEQETALWKMFGATREVVDAFDPFTPWGAASRGIARELRLDLDGAQPEQLRQAPDANLDRRESA
jgi:hypothetical protein